MKKIQSGKENTRIEVMGFANLAIGVNTELWAHKTQNKSIKKATEEEGERAGGLIKLFFDTLLWKREEKVMAPKVSLYIYSRKALSTLLSCWLSFRPHMASQWWRVICEVFVSSLWSDDLRERNKKMVVIEDWKWHHFLSFNFLHGAENSVSFWIAFKVTKIACVCLCVSVCLRVCISVSFCICELGFFILP